MTTALMIPTWTRSTVTGIPLGMRAITALAAVLIMMGITSVKEYI